MIDSSDQLRTPDTVCLPDARSPQSDFLTRQPLTVDHQYSAISEYVLHDGVPEDIRIQFETTKNLYLYAWYVYRFYPVVKLHAYTCLELGLRVRFGRECTAALKKQSDYIYLGTILEATPALRNHYAHGSKSLDNQALNTVRLVFEIVSQIFPENDVSATKDAE